MQVFKTYFKVLKRGAIVSLLINLVVVITISSFFSFTNFKENKDFRQSKSTVAVFNNDKSEFSDTFCKYLESECKIVKVNNSDVDRKKALYYGTADLIVTIPKGFGELFINKEDVKLITECNPSKKTSNYGDININKYLSLFRGYLNSTDLSISEINEMVCKDLSVQTEVVLRNSTTRSHLSSKSMFYNFANYPLCVLLICSLAHIAFAFNNKDVVRRNNCSSLKMSSFNFQMVLGHLCVTILAMAVVMLIGVVMFNVDITSPDGYLHYLNIMVFTVVALGLAYLISNIANKRSIDPIANVVTLGTCFLGGSFVPQEFLSGGIKYTAIINPVWWFVKANNTISSVSEYNFKNLKNAYMYMGIEILFAIVLFLATFCLLKYKRTKD